MKEKAIPSAIIGSKQGRFDVNGTRMSISDTITLKRLKVFAHHGVLPEEQSLGQSFLISVTCGLDVREAAMHDSCELSVNYATLAEHIYHLATTRRFRTLEALAQAVADDVLGVFKRVNDVHVSIEKPQAPLPFAFETVEVAIHRRREG